MVLNILIIIGIAGLAAYCLYSAYRNDGTSKNISLNIAITIALIGNTYLLANRNDALSWLLPICIVIFLHNAMLLSYKRWKQKR